MAAKRDAILEQADSLWKMLDDLAETNPEGYKKLMDKIINEQQEQWKPPEPVFCFRSEEIPASSKHHVFINVCKWDKVSKPKDDNDRISVIASTLRSLPDCSSKQSVMDICFHSEIIAEAGSLAYTQKLIAPLALDYVEARTGLKLSKTFKVLSIKYKGDVNELRRLLFSRNFSHENSAKEMDKQGKNGFVLDGLSRIVQHGREHKPDGAPKNVMDLSSHSLLAHDDEKSSRKPLIQEVTTSRHNKSKTIHGLPKYTMEVIKATVTSPGSIVVKVELPEVNSGAECELDVSQQDLVLCSPEYSKLKLWLPATGNKDETTSTFNKTTHQLVIMIPIAKH